MNHCTLFTAFTLATAASLAFVGGCDDKKSNNASSGQGISGLSSNPTSIPGKSAQMGKNAAAGIQNQQDIAANAANQITGQAAGEEVVGGLKFPIPDGWKSVAPSSNFTKATYMIPDAGNAQCNFSTAGGDVDSNISRWRGQITDASGQQVQGEVTEETVAGFRVVVFKATGSYSGMGGTKQANTAFRGAIIKTPSNMIFVKLTGPADKIAKADAGFDALVSGFKQ